MHHALTTLISAAAVALPGAGSGLPAVQAPAASSLPAVQAPAASSLPAVQAPAAHGYQTGGHQTGGRVR